jgi:hypothetical protein
MLVRNRAYEDLANMSANSQEVSLNTDDCSIDGVELSKIWMPCVHKCDEFHYI